MDLLMTHLSETGTADCEEEKIRENNLAHHAIVVLNIAAGRNFLSLVDYILQWGAKECIEDHSNLFEAAKAGHFKVVQRLIDAGADRVRAEDWVPILQACDSVEVISLLLNKSSKPEINMVTRNGTALQVACCRHSSEMVELLLKHGANPNQEMGKFSWVDHPLIQAVNQGFAEIVRMLLEAGANVDARTTNDNTPLHYALYSSKIESNDACLRTLLEFSPELDFQDRQGDTALNCLVKTTPVLSVRLLLNAGADPEIPNDEDLTPIFHAIQMQNFDVAQFLIKKGVSINFSAGEIGGPIHLACKENSLDLIDVLIKHGADVDLMADGFVGTPLQSAFSHWDDHDLQKNIVNRLLDAKADVNRKGGRYGYTINFAFLVCPPEIVQLLLNSGADTDVEDRYGRNPAHLASLRTITHVEKLQSSPQLFQRKDHLGRNALHYAVGSGRLDVVKRVFEICKGDIDVRDMDDWTPLMWAARCHQKPSDNYFGGQNGAENEEIIQFLVKTCGADIRARGRGWDREWSPLKLARYHGASQTIRDLLSPLSLRHENISGPPDEEVPQNIHHGEVNTLHDQETNSSPFLESDKKFHRSKTAREHQDLYCDSCLYVSFIDSS
ncbi:Serine/threonine-protein phosphatase 6 regulatory ankyrin repeat subunit B [Daldinia childiae]|uniref:Serine/threonine-protein phosphatase 6 regulatory ankyrin repeat subunit B n=1 Tax=Daldinia childiae TaxID=326645 RepID=UPI0014487626|nr:Serine/threonine-protein phosphatase 6 regulatory ankyrin repeat subunit B [Daldinia childiae]KAF3063839.1 Serine/threonine-protein phosphatase 6 regulatory ankyrin repeat subunit B [Daldinia childiae]